MNISIRPHTRWQVYTYLLHVVFPGRVSAKNVGQSEHDQRDNPGVDLGSLGKCRSEDEGKEEDRSRGKFLCEQGRYA